MGRGGCASGDVYSARAGADVLAAGGNAVDAAVAAALVSGYAVPTLSGIGGAGLMTCRVGGDVIVCDAFAAVPGRGRDSSPPGGRRTVVVDFEGIPRPFLVGPASVAVPGLVAGLWEMHARHGRMPLPEVAAPAVAAARDGRPITPGQRGCLGILREILQTTPGSWELVSRDDVLLGVGDALRNPDLAVTLETLAREGDRPFYEGEIARAIVEATEGCVTLDDLAAYEPAFGEPLRGGYRGSTVYVPGAPSLTGARVLRTLGRLEADGPLPRRFDAPAWDRVRVALAEGAALRTAEFERRLFEDGYLEHVVRGSLPGNTLHIAAADATGDVASLTVTVGETAGVVAPGTGVFLNNFLGEDDIQPTGGPLPAGHRMLTALCPTLVYDGDERWTALGSAGSARIPSTVTQVIAHLVDGGAHPAEAVRRPRVHCEDGTFFVEGWGRTRDEVEALRGLAPETEVTWECGYFFGAAQVVVREGDQFAVGADEMRRGGAGFVV